MQMHSRRPQIRLSLLTGGASGGSGDAFYWLIETAALRTRRSFSHDRPASTHLSEEWSAQGPVLLLGVHPSWSVQSKSSPWPSSTFCQSQSPSEKEQWFDTEARKKTNNTLFHVFYTYYFYYLLIIHMRNYICFALHDGSSTNQGKRKVTKYRYNKYYSYSTSAKFTS